MKRLAYLVFALLTAVPVHAAVLVFTASVPTDNDSGATCTQHIYAAATDSVWAVWSIPAAAITDSLWLARGTVLTRAYTVAAGTYTVTMRTVRVPAPGLRIASCDTSVTRVAYARGRMIFDLR